MIVDYESLAEGPDFEADVCIVGSGPAGISLAREFFGSPTKVLLVECGGSGLEPSSDVLNRGQFVDRPLLGLTAGRSRAFGGATKLWNGQCIRLDDEDFEHRAWVPFSGWPIGAGELTSYYERAGTFLGLPDDDEDLLVRKGIALPDFRPDSLEYGSSVFAPQLDVAAVYRSEFARSSNVRVLLHANATRIETAENGRSVRNVALRSLAGKCGRVTAPAVVLAGGGVENPRMLLLSSVGNQHDLVGRFFQEHPRTHQVVFRADLIDDVRRLYPQAGMRGAKYLPKMRLAPSVQRSRGVLNCVADFSYQYEAGSTSSGARTTYHRLRERWGGERACGVAGKLFWGVDRRALAAYGRYVRTRVTSPRIGISLEFAPNPQNRVTLADECDPLGVPMAKVEWRLTDLERRTAQVMAETLSTEFSRLGIGRLGGTEWMHDTGWDNAFEEAYHHMGTTRMSLDPAGGVVDTDCMVHGVEGLYVTGSSVFPTSGYANPTLTIVALALRLADHLKARGLPRP